MLAFEVFVRSFAAVVSEIMRLKGVSQNEISRRLGIEQSTVSKYCRGLRTPGWDVAVRFAEALEVTPNDLLAIPSPRIVDVMGTVAAGSFDTPSVFDPPQKHFTLQHDLPKGVFALRVQGGSCAKFGILSGDLVFVEEATEPLENRFVVVRNAEGHTLKAYHRGKLWRFQDGDASPTPVDAIGSTGIVGIVVGGEYGEREFRHKVEKKSKAKDEE